MSEAGTPGEADVAHAVKARAFALDFSPVVDLEWGKTVAAEAHVRLVNSLQPHAPLLPAAFRTVAERAGLGVEIDTYVVESCARLAARLTGPDGLDYLCFPVATSSLADRQILTALRFGLDQHGLTPSRLQVAVTEDAVLGAHPDALATVEALAEIGVRLQLDGFPGGTGALSALRRVPFTTLKVDESVVAPLAVSGDAERLMRAFVDIGHAAGLRVVADGVERADQLRILRAVGCDAAQGALLGRPGAVTALERQLGGEPRW